MGRAQSGFSRFAGDVFGAQIDQHDVALGAAADDAQTTFGQCFRHDLSAFFITCVLVSLEAGVQGFFESHGLGRDHMHQGATLQAREDRAVDGFFVLGLHQDDAATRTAQAFVGGGGDHIRVGHRVGVDTPAAIKPA